MQVVGPVVYGMVQPFPTAHRGLDQMTTTVQQAYEASQYCQPLWMQGMQLSGSVLQQVTFGIYISAATRVSTMQYLPWIIQC